MHFIFFENLWIVDEIIFIDEKEHPFFDNQFSFLVNKQGDHSLIFSDLNFYRVRILAKFGARISADFIEQFWNLRDSFVIPRNIANHTKNSRFENMAQKCVAKSSPFGSAFDETGNIDDIEMSFLDRHRSEIWYQGREWIVSDFSFGI